METPTSLAPPRACDYCGKTFKTGRQDRKYCDVKCKNNFNSRLRAAFRAEMHPNLKAVIKTIKNNYEILMTYPVATMEEGKEMTVKTEEMRRKGFKKDFCTSVHDYHRGKIWKCCMDLCWQEEGQNYLILRRMPSQASI